jgi:glycine cleavage system H protein
VESVKAASDIYAPVTGEITEANPALSADPGLINREPYGAGWLFRIQADVGKDHALLSASAYAATLSS